jgi:hypothetical protein
VWILRKQYASFDGGFKAFYVTEDSSGLRMTELITIAAVLCDAERPTSVDMGTYIVKRFRYFTETTINFTCCRGSPAELHSDVYYHIIPRFYQAMARSDVPPGDAH